MDSRRQPCTCAYCTPAGVSACSAKEPKTHSLQGRHMIVTVLTHELRLFRLVFRLDLSSGLGGAVATFWRSCWLYLCHSVHRLLLHAASKVG